MGVLFRCLKSSHQQWWAYARLSAKDATHVILGENLLQHYHAAVNTKKITAITCFDSNVLFNAQYHMIARSIGV